MRDESANRYARRAQARTLPKQRSLHYHCGESLFMTRREASEYARSVTADLRRLAEPDGFLSYVISVSDVIEDALSIQSCNQDCMF